MPPIPPVTKWLLIVNTAAFFIDDLLRLSTGVSFGGWFALWPLGHGFLPWQVVTYAFLHGDLLHLLFNMFGLWTFGSELERLVTLATNDDLWSDYLAAANELRAGTIWFSLAGADPFRDYVARVHAMFQEFTRTIDAEVPVRLERAAARGADPRQRGATWTYLTTDEPFGSMTERAMRGLARMVRQRSGWGSRSSSRPSS